MVTLNILGALGILIGGLYAVNLKQRQFDQNGLRYSVQHLASIMPNIVHWDLEKQAEYVDAVTKDAVDTCMDMLLGVEHYLDEYGNVIISSEELNNLNATGVGNMAYVALYSKHPHISEAAKKILEHTKKYYAQKS